MFAHTPWWGQSNEPVRSQPCGQEREGHPQLIGSSFVWHTSTMPSTRSALQRSALLCKISVIKGKLAIVGSSSAPSAACCDLCRLKVIRLRGFSKVVQRRWKSLMGLHQLLAFDLLKTHSTRTRNGSLFATKARLSRQEILSPPIFCGNRNHTDL